MIPAGRLHDEDVHAFLFGEGGTAADGLIEEIDVAGVENAPAFRVDQDAGRSQNVAGVEQFEAHVRLLGAREAFAVQAPGLAQGAILPLVRTVIGLPMGKKRLRRRRVGAAVLSALLAVGLAHDVDRVVQQHFSEAPGRRAHQDAGLRLAAHQHGQRADMIQVRMADQDGVEGPIRDQAQVG